LFYVYDVFGFQVSAISFTFNEDDQTGPQVRFTLPVAAILKLHSVF